MDPASALATVNPLLQAAESIRGLLAGAEVLAPDDARYYATYLEVATRAIQGLEGEYNEILRAAAYCQPGDPQQRERLLRRVDDYLHGEVLRPKLKEAIERLRQGRQALQQHADRLLIWLFRPGVRRGRVDALALFDRLLDRLEGYYGSLGGYAGPSAHALDDIRRIRERIAGPDEGFADVINDLLMNLDKSTLLTTTGEFGRAIEALRIAFR
jgi:hypothetical protein